MAKNRLNRAGKKSLWGLLLLLAASLVAWSGVSVEQAEATPSAAPSIQGGTSGGAGAPAVQAPAATAAVPAEAAQETGAKRGPAGPAGGEALVPMPERSPKIVGRRDPFKLPGPPGPGGPGDDILGPLPPGKRGLVISRLILEGIVRLDTTNDMIAVVDTNANRAYFLRENDEVFNGVVSKITPDSVYFRENVLDQYGRVQTREVVKRLGQGPGEGR